MRCLSAQHLALAGPVQGMTLQYHNMHACRPLGSTVRMRGLYEEVQSAAAALLPAEVDTLVIYTYSKTDVEYEKNLAFFVQHGMWEGDGCEYLIIVQQARVSF